MGVVVDTRIAAPGSAARSAATTGAAATVSPTDTAWTHTRPSGGAGPSSGTRPNRSASPSRDLPRTTSRQARYGNRIGSRIRL